MKLLRFIVCFLFFTMLACQHEKQDFFLQNEEGNLQIKIQTDQNGKPFYQLFYQNQMLLDSSFLGMELEALDLTKGLEIKSVERLEDVHDEYTMFHGKQKEIVYDARAYKASFVNEEGIELGVQFQLSKNGFAFRYELADGLDSVVRVLNENSTYGFSSTTKAWLQPMSVAKTGWCETNPSYEEHYLKEVAVDTESPLKQGFVFPALFKVGDSWLSLTETNLHRDYCGSRLKYDAAQKGMKITFPQEAEIFPDGELIPNGQLPFISPWRTIAVGSVADIVESTLGTDLAAPAIDTETNHIKSGLASWSWVLLKDDFTNYETSHRFIDYASEMNWPYCLIDADWDWKIGYEKMQELVDYANSKNVKILLWYNSSGPWNSTKYTPKGKLLTHEMRVAEFSRLEKMGVAGCKIDFFGGDGQSMIAYYHDMLKDAADHNLLINFHGATLPRGWHRTYPNLMTIEAIKGQEFITFDQPIADEQPAHCATIPFTRNVYDPMDFTPMVLDSIPNIHRRTTAAFELALPVLFTSGVQHMAEIPEGMQKMSEEVKEYLRHIPTQWDETKFISGYPGKDVVLARRKGDTWFITGINGEKTAKEIEIDLSFVGNENGIIFFDGSTKFPENKTIKKEKLNIPLKPYGGFVIKI